MAGAALWFVAGLVLLALGGDSIVKGASGLAQRIGASPFIAGLLLVAYTALAFIRALRYYWAHRKESPYAATPLAFCTVFILVGMFESVYAPFSVIGCAYFLVQAPLWRAE